MMSGRDIAIAAVLAVLIHCGVALVPTPAPRPPSPPRDRALAISVMPAYQGTPPVSEIAVRNAAEEAGEKDEREETTPTEEGVKRDDLPSEGMPAGMSAIPPPLRAKPDAGKQTEKIVTEPPIPCYKSNTSPHYPEIARRRGYEGEVLLSVMVLVDGTVGEVRVKKPSGHPILDRAAVRAVTAWEFEPARRMGIPVPLSVDIPVRFVLRGP
ncbi:MAG: energy transducer TonB [Deltaproteobacteria bacterium]|nr:energy transducer TonB [Deltaproteobacteria bacterium]